MDTNQTPEELITHLRAQLVTARAERDHFQTEASRLRRLGGVKAPESLPPEALAEARAWLAEIQWADASPEDIASMDARTIVAAIQRHWDGGLRDFLTMLANPVTY